VFALTALGEDLAKLEGKWTVKKTRDGQSYTQIIEIKKDTFKFKIIRGSDEVANYAEGKLKLEKSGPFNVVKFTDIKVGASESDISAIDDDRISIYVLGDDTWTLAANFDKDRADQKPILDAYTKAAKRPKTSQPIGAVVFRRTLAKTGGGNGMDQTPDG